MNSKWRMHKNTTGETTGDEDDDDDDDKEKEQAAVAHYGGTGAL